MIITVVSFGMVYGSLIIFLESELKWKQNSGKGYFFRMWKGNWDVSNTWGWKCDSSENTGPTTMTQCVAILMIHTTLFLPWILNLWRRFEFAITCTKILRAPVFGRHQFFGTSEHYGKAHGRLLSWWMNYNYTGFVVTGFLHLAIFHTSITVLDWQIRFESYWLHCSKCRIVVFLR